MSQGQPAVEPPPRSSQLQGSCLRSLRNPAACQDQALGAYPDVNPVLERATALSAEIPPLGMAQQNTAFLKPISLSVQHEEG